MIVAAFVLSAAAFYYAARAARNGRGWVAASGLALVLGLFGCAAQAFEYAHIPFGPQSGGYASVFFGWTVLYVVVALIAMYRVETVFAAGLRNRRPDGRRDPGGLRPGRPLLGAAGGDRRIRLDRPLPDLNRDGGADHAPRLDRWPRAALGPWPPRCSTGWGAGMVARAPERGDRWRTAAFAAGLLAILAAVDSPIDELADQLFWVHMVQHILLIGVAPPLLALARPWTRMWRGIPIEYRRPPPARSPPPALGAAAAGGRPSPAAPLASWLIFNVNFCAWHLPVLYDAALRSPAIHALEHFLFFAHGAALLDPRDLLAALALTAQRDWGNSSTWARPSSSAGCWRSSWRSPPRRFTRPTPSEASRPGHISALTDQQLAAGVMWVPGSLAYTIAIVVIAYRWLEPRNHAGLAPGRRPKPYRQELDEMDADSAAARDRWLDELLGGLLDRVPPGRDDRRARLVRGGTSKKHP